jgi:hypothetical protein
VRTSTGAARVFPPQDLSRARLFADRREPPRRRPDLEKARDCILITIGPTTDGVYWALDRCVVLAYRSVLPIRIASLVLQRIFLEQRYVLKALQPHRSPAIADQRRIGRKAHQAEKEKGPLKASGGKKRAAHVVRVIGVPIVG